MRLSFHLMIHVTLAIAVAPMVTVAQSVPWQVFQDVTGETCEVVHAANADLVVLSSTGQLTIVTGQDITLQDTAVDTGGSVFFEGAEAGLISFQVDGDGVRTLWWTSLTGRVVSGRVSSDFMLGQIAQNFPLGVLPNTMLLVPTGAVARPEGHFGVGSSFKVMVPEAQRLVGTRKLRSIKRPGR